MSMILIQRQVLSSSAASVTFSNVPQNYRTLRILGSARNVGPLGDLLYINFNGSALNFNSRWLYGNGSFGFSGTSSTTYSELAGWISDSSYTSNTFGNFELTIPNYASSTSYKVISSDSVQENNSTYSVAAFVANLWSNTSPITSITLKLPSTESFAANSSFSLYGLL